MNARVRSIVDVDVALSDRTPEEERTVLPKRDESGPRKAPHRVSDRVAALRPMRQEARDRAKGILERIKQNLPLEAIGDDGFPEQEKK